MQIIVVGRGDNNARYARIVAGWWAVVLIHNALEVVFTLYLSRMQEFWLLFWQLPAILGLAGLGFLIMICLPKGYDYNNRIRRGAAESRLGGFATLSALGWGAVQVLMLGRASGFSFANLLPMGM